MTKITYVQQDGTRRTLDAEDGVSVMFTAVQSGVHGIVAECGGVMSCATCHVYVDEEWTDRIGPPGEDESDMLDAVSAERLPTSRLSCQIEVGPDVDGLVVHVPAGQ